MPSREDKDPSTRLRNSEVSAGSDTTGSGKTNSTAEFVVMSLSKIRKLPDGQAQYTSLLALRASLTTLLGDLPGPCPELILARAEVYQALGYADLALADAYVSYSLCLEALGEGSGDEDLVACSEDGGAWPSDVPRPCVNEDEGERDNGEIDEEEGHDGQASSNDDGEGDGCDNYGDYGDHEGNVVVSEIALEMQYRSLLALMRASLLLGVHEKATLWYEGATSWARIVVQCQSGDELMDDRVEQAKIICRDLCGCEKATIFEDENARLAALVDDLQHGRLKLTNSGNSRREIYPWNEYEPNRLSQDSTDEINAQLRIAAPDLEARVSNLPLLTSTPVANDTANGSAPEYPVNGSTSSKTSSQLGLFAKKDLPPGSVVLKERSILTGIRPHGEAICDACAADLEPIPLADQRTCPACGTPFCSEECQTLALERYHAPNVDDEETENGYPPSQAPFCPGTVANDDINTLARAESSATPEWDLYFLLLSRTIQMSETQSIHPLEMFEIKYLWGDFSPPSSSPDHPQIANERTLPFSTRHTVELPLQLFSHLLHSRPTTCRPYSQEWLKKYDWWILQTLYAKFRGVADARQSTWSGKPEIAGVHALWCLANHSCRPNVTWRPGGVRNLTVVEGRVGGGPGWRGIKEGEEIWNHYTDIAEKDYRVRRERLRAVLGGNCLCERCLAEGEVSRAGQGS